jgi:hypothetical protein
MILAAGIIALFLSIPLSRIGRGMLIASRAQARREDARMQRRYAIVCIIAGYVLGVAGAWLTLTGIMGLT